MSQYKRIPAEEIERTGKYDPTKALLMVVANAALKDAATQAVGKKTREHVFHESGWNITLHDGSPTGAVGLYSSLLNDKIFLGYPKNIEVADWLIMEVLGVQDARAVIQTAEPTPHMHGPRRWTTFYEPREQGGHPVVEKSNFVPFGYSTTIETPQGELVEICFGNDDSSGIHTFSSAAMNSGTMSTYTTGFLTLAAETAILIGQPSKVTVDYGFAMVPEDLEREGYQNIVWLKGKAGTRRGWGNELVRAEKDGEIVLLKSRNSLIPWSTIRQVEVPKPKRNARDLVRIIQELRTF